MGDPCGCTDFCNLPPERQRERIAMIRGHILPQARDHERLRDGVVWTFEGTALRSELEQLVAFERECCPGLGFELEERDGGLRLEIRGADPDGGAFELLGVPRESGGGDAPAPGGRASSRGRLVGASAVGIALALLVCEGPLLLAALGGAALAAPLAGLDRPWILAAVALGSGTLAWWLMRRRALAR